MNSQLFEFWENPLVNMGRSQTECMKMWHKTAEEAGKSFQNLLNITGGIPKENHQELVNKYEALKKKCEDQEEIIKQLDMMQSEKFLEQEKVVKKFQNLIEKQNDQFQNLMNLSDKFFTPASTPQKKVKTVQDKGKSTVKNEKKSMAKKG
jgi:hypothetical protein